MKPYSGQIFRDIETCFKFYAEYGRQGGFDIRKSSQKVRDGIVVYKYFLCSKGGNHETSMSKESDSNSDMSLVSSTAGVDVRRRRRTVTKKCQCEAKVQLKYGGFNQYIISCFVEGHNHPLASTSGKQFLRINRTISSLQRRFILDAAKSNIGAHRAHSLYKSIAGSYTNIGATATDFQNWVRILSCILESMMRICCFKNSKISERHQMLDFLMSMKQIRIVILLVYFGLIFQDAKVMKCLVMWSLLMQLIAQISMLVLYLYKFILFVLFFHLCFCIIYIV